jgi:hypothetical protein
MSKHHEIAGSHFSKKTLKALEKKGITIHSATWTPGYDGSYANGFTCYMLDDNGTGRMRSFIEVLDIAGEGNLI